MRFLIAAIAIIPAGLALAVPPLPPRVADDAIGVPPTTPRDLVRELRLGEFTARFENTPLREIAEQLGGGVIGHFGDASESVRWLCYSLPGQLVWLTSGPMGGSEDLLLQVVAEQIRDFDPREPECAPVPETHRPVSLEFGWLGTSEAELRKKLGAPSGRTGDWQIFFFAGKLTAPYRAPGAEKASLVDYDVIAYVEAKVERGVVTALRASHVTSY